MALLFIKHVTALLVGFLAAFVGLLAPAMLNMTAAKISIERGKSAGIKFSFGAAIILMIHCAIAVFFAKYLVANPQIIEKLKIAAVFVFFILAIFFYLQAKKEQTVTGKTNKNGHPFVIGLGMALLNMLGIPFYLTMATLAETNGFITLEMPFSGLFIFGAFIGDFSLFSLYAIFAATIAKRATFIAKNINYILSGLFVVLFLLAIYQVFS